MISISPTDTTAYEIVLDIEAIGAQPRRVATTQTINGRTPSPRERVYVVIDPDNPDVVAVLPESLGGQTLPAESNRLEPRVLGPEILQKGATAKGVVVSAVELPMENRVLAAKGCSTWELIIDVRPDDGSPVYRAPLLISFTIGSVIIAFGILRSFTPAASRRRNRARQCYIPTGFRVVVGRA